MHFRNPTASATIAPHNTFSTDKFLFIFIASNQMNCFENCTSMHIKHYSIKWNCINRHRIHIQYPHEIEVVAALSHFDTVSFSFGLLFHHSIWFIKFYLLELFPFCETKDERKSTTAPPPLPTNKQVDERWKLAKLSIIKYDNVISL